ncbi:glycosyltransferase, partial [Candidatus Bathyarchaeota archaeon]|nr:glycosyltransferase [Candidatus Bathyarchaeota archaeon]
MKPFFTIGVTVYDRKEFLHECLTSVLQQTFKDFEIIVANDYTGEKLSPEMFGINDPRVRFVNNPQNLGEVKNMNSLMNMSRGRYFTWLADDDIYLPDFLKTVHTAMEEYGFPPCVFTSYMQGSALPPQTDISKPKIQVLHGRDFLRRYLSRELKVSGTLGVFDSKYIKEVGGIEQLGNGFSPYADNLLAIKAGLQKKVVYIDAPLIFFRTHDQSISYVGQDVDIYSSAQKDLLSKSIEVFASEGLSDDF